MLFTPGSRPVALADDEIHVWLLATDGGPDAAHRYDSRVRGLLAAYLGCAPEAVRLAVGEHGKPFLDGPFLTGARVFDE